MLAASYWSLLEPALEMAAGLETYGENGQWAFLPVSLGFFLGAAFVFMADLVMSSTGVTSPVDLIDKKVETDSESPLPELENQFQLSGESGLRLRRGFEAGSEVYSIGEQEREEELKKKETQWRLTSLKRHAETNKLEQAIKVSQKNEGLLKKKADMLELSLMSHQKSMEKGRAKMVQEQLKERNGQLEQQHELSDIHANASKRKTFTQTFDLQMKTLDTKLAECK